ncbi:MAG: general secretion pathway protein D [Phenylobacterium sp.]|jgi:general secretion pathway protein D
MINVMRKGVLLLGFAGLASLAGCTSTNSLEKYKVNPPLFEETNQLVAGQDKINVDSQGNRQNGKAPFSRLKSMADLFNADQESKRVAATFSEADQVRYSVDAMKLSEFIHHVFRDILGVNYVVDNTLTNLASPVTLNFQNLISKKEAFLASSDILLRQQIGVTVKDSVYYLFPMETKSAGDVSIGVGRTDADLPLTQGKVLQIVPMNFGMNIGIERTLRDLSDIAVTVDMDKNAVFLQGARSKVRKVMELARILDMPSNQGKHIGLLRLTYLSTQEFSKQISQLMEAEGIPVGVGNAKQKNVVLVPLNQIGLVAVFANNGAFLSRIQFWHEQLDQPSQGDAKRYFMYEPQNARARDLGESLSPLFGGSVPTTAKPKGNSSRDTRSALRSSTATPVSSAGDDDLTMVIDERTNTLIFYTTSMRYQQLRPLIKRMDTLPRQVILEATIAEVTLSGEFKHGVEFAVANGSFGFGTKGAFKATDIGGFAAGWVRPITSSLENVSVNLIKTNSLVNVLSSPTLLVRDGVSASITVGNEIPLVTSTISVPITGTENERTTTTIERRQIGLTLSVTPTINSQGIVIMEIMLDISNELAISGNSTLLNRQVQTEVVANSGQTIILAGLISENKSNGDSGVPVLGDLPVLGNLFKSATQNKDKTELVILVTPKIINGGEQWDEIKNKFRKGLENVEF